MSGLMRWLDHQGRRAFGSRNHSAPLLIARALVSAFAGVFLVYELIEFVQQPPGDPWQLTSRIAAIGAMGLAPWIAAPATALAVIPLALALEHGINGVEPFVLLICTPSAMARSRAPQAAFVALAGIAWVVVVHRDDLDSV
ncbi:MAG: hypothetical protein Q4F67_08100, partial [Propionibacteriaceae bacterium]|nr:hypothetical protein [Propionibacteriaceae bacterium]